MPKLYEYRGFVFYIYSNEHNPPHCHVKKTGRRYKVNLNDIGGVVLSELESTTRLKFSHAEIQIVEDFLRIYGSGIIEKWNLYFSGKNPRCEKIKPNKKGRKKDQAS